MGPLQREDHEHPGLVRGSGRPPAELRRSRVRRARVDELPHEPAAADARVADRAAGLAAPRGRDRPVAADRDLHRGDPLADPWSEAARTCGRSRGRPGCCRARHGGQLLERRRRRGRR